MGFVEVTSGVDRERPLLRLGYERSRQHLLAGYEDYCTLSDNTQTSVWDGRFGYWLTVTLLIAGSVVTLIPLWPFITQDSWPQLFEIGFHHIPMRDWPDWLRTGQTIGWDHSFANGYPTYHFYFPAPALAWTLLSVVLPDHTAYILLTVLPIPGLLVAVFWLARTLGLGRGPSVLMGCSATVVWAGANNFGLLYGIPSFLYGIYAHAWAVVVGVCFLAAYNRVLTADRARRLWWVLGAGGLLAACFLSHALIGALVGLAALPLAWRRRKPYAVVFALGVGLTAWWWLPAVGMRHMSASRHLAVTPWSGVFSPICLMALPFAAFGVWKLWRLVNDRRKLLPWAVLTAGALVHRLFITDGDAFHAGGRTFTFWYLAVLTLAVWAGVAILVAVGRCWRDMTQVVGVMVLMGVYVMVLSNAGLYPGGPGINAMVDWKNVDSELVDNHTPLPGCSAVVGGYRSMPPSTFLDVFWGGLWNPTDECRLTMAQGLSTQAFGDQHRQTNTVVFESSPTHYFMEAALRSTTLLYPPAYSLSGYYGPHFSYSPVDWGRASAQMATLGVDFYRAPTSSPYPPTDKPWVTVHDRWDEVTTYRIASPPDMWNAEWVDLSPSDWLKQSRKMFNTWADPDDVTILVRGQAPANPTPLWTARPDWSQDNKVTFTADRAGLYYVPVSYHPNWELASPGAGPWQAGPNQMVVHAATEGPVRLEFVSSGWERTGQAITLITVAAGLVVIVIRLVRARFFNPHPPRRTGASPATTQ